MNPHLNYLIATQRIAELTRVAERARLAERARPAQEEPADEPKGRRGRLAARTVLRLRLRGGQRLRARRA